MGNIEKMIGSMKQTARDLGLAFGEVVNIYNTRLAQELGCWAESKNKEEAFHQAAFAEYFVKGENLADRTVLEDLAVSIGLDVEETRDVLDQRKFKNVVDADWQLAVDSNITAVPTFIINHERMVGAQSYDTLKRLMDRHDVSSVD